MTSDAERQAVLWQNELLRERYGAVPGLFQKLRRCCICLASSCADQSSCRVEFARWAKRCWVEELRAEHARRNPGVECPDVGELLAS